MFHIGIVACKKCFSENLIPPVPKLRPKSTLPLGSSLPLPCNERQDKTRFKGYARWYKVN